MELEPFQGYSPVSGTNYLEFDGCWPPNGTAVSPTAVKRIKSRFLSKTKEARAHNQICGALGRSPRDVSIDASLGVCTLPVVGEKIRPQIRPTVGMLNPMRDKK